MVVSFQHAGGLPDWPRFRDLEHTDASLPGPVDKLLEEDVMTTVPLDRAGIRPEPIRRRHDLLEPEQARMGDRLRRVEMVGEEPVTPGEELPELVPQYPPGEGNERTHQLGIGRRPVESLGV